LMNGHAFALCGVVSDIRFRPTRKTGFVQHQYVIDGEIYSDLQKIPVALAKPGDTISFQWKRVVGSGRHRGRRFNNILPGTLKIVVTRESRDRADGYVYVFTNPAMRGLLKIGFTTDSPEGRARALPGTTGVPVPFAVAWAAPVAGDAQLIESAV